MKNIKPFFLFLKDLLEWLLYPNCFGIYERNDAKELWCEHFGHNERNHLFRDVRVSDEKVMHEHGFASIKICMRCANPIGNPTVQTMPLGRPD